MPPLIIQIDSYYMLVINIFKFENYLNFISENKYRVLLSKFRLSTQDLAIEQGRYQITDRSETIGIFYNSNFVDNGYHFVLTCLFYRDVQRKYLKSYYCLWPTLNTFDDLLSKRSKLVILNLTKFI